MKKRIRRTKEELAAGLSIEEAKKLREEKGLKTPVKTSGSLRLAKAGDGEIVIRIRPEKGMEFNPEWRLPDGEFVIEQDRKFYAWLDELLSVAYTNASPETLIRHLIHKGHEELVVGMSLPEDVEQLENLLNLKS